MKKGFLYFSVFVVVFFSVSLIISVNNEEKKIDNNYFNEEIYGDKEDYAFSFNEKTIENEKIVAFDNTNNDYVKYFVVEFLDNQFISYSYYFLKNHEQYLHVYEDLIPNIVDYNYEEFMIKTLDNISYATYEEFTYNIQELIDNNSIYLIY